MGIESQKLKRLPLMFAVEVCCLFVESAIELSIESGTMEFRKFCAIELSIASGTRKSRKHVRS
jgi:hypothetical protein